MLSQLGRAAAQVGMATALLGLLAMVDHVPIGSPPQEAMVRLAGRMVGGKLRVCRDLTPAELAGIPKHMQAAGQRCDQSILPYRLQVWVNDAQQVDAILQPAGVRGDRPVYVHEELLLPPGTHRVRVAFEPQPAPAAGQPSGQQSALQQAVQQAARYPLERTLDLRAGTIILVELNEKTRTWEVHGGEP